MTPIKDLEVGWIYAHDRSPNSRWIILMKEPCVGGFRLEYTTVGSDGVWAGETTVEILDPDHTWPVESDTYLISEEEDVSATGSP